ncbi:DNA-binding NarL/FixJ family response regulator [Clostridium acetobutylicum]|uniref:Stage 0 sporulation protein A homolog n=1 Tax=Clostridium acetobutylicum (strain ATCC 824 / DSM 792 / JCM 1419 / IAM 19013 / LMG 5710 / NBRC 13948 / NRRL B-527 / VKM B-1787 / 2291 / W) TaxID=272562 RepID=Q97GW1_CLOAB|nr:MULTISPECIES: response regulator transcription factor [Clostridium]AAK80211.1 Response regulator (CheY-like receiver domain and HTH-type DNA-binding domain) [Clostridium acetobutylicum ATCC 824]ADZ21306.1 Response regulator (CheY-like receiver domain and HTH-type DNA-binding domain) [Clostridium acetobutylicum EA 2018]AEI34303.1 response regulator [Clostridium acetobutylicum DSM 1731]AWV79364.1 DNA-binding response regulator [Clostridium acetobutylicum]MBC2394665.1 response regulator transc
MIRVMIADDQVIVREGLKKILSLDDEIEVICEAEDGYDVINKLREHIVDIILMDVRMPKMDGIKTTNLVKKQYPKINIIILTTFDEDEYIFNGIKSGISGYLLKDSEIDYILKSVKEAYNNKMMFDPVVTPKLVNALNLSNNINSTNKEILSVLTEREMEITKLVTSGKSNKEISETLFISEGTVKNYISKILKKLKLQRRTQLLAIFINDET